MKTEETTTFATWQSLSELAERMERDKKSALSKEQFWLAEKIDGEMTVIGSAMDFLAGIPQSFATLIDKCPKDMDASRIIVLFADKGECVQHDYDKTKVCSAGSLNGCIIDFATLKTE